MHRIFSFFNTYVPLLWNFSLLKLQKHTVSCIRKFTRKQKNYSELEIIAFVTGKSFSEALILASTNPQYGKRLFIDLPVQYMKTTSSEHVVYINCFECQNKKKQFMYTACSELVVFM